MSNLPTPADHAALRHHAEQRRHALTRQRIIGIRASYRAMPVKEIAFRLGVSLDYVEQALGEAAKPSFAIG